MRIDRVNCNLVQQSCSARNPNFIQNRIDPFAELSKDQEIKGGQF